MFKKTKGSWNEVSQGKYFKNEEGVNWVNVTNNLGNAKQNHSELLLHITKMAIIKKSKDNTFW